MHHCVFTMLFGGLRNVFGKIVAATITFFHIFSGRPRGNKNAATIPGATLLLLPMVLVE